MIWSRIAVYGTITMMTLLAGTGCLERKEKIKVRPDGGVTISLKYKGTEEELDSVDAMPSGASGWSVTRKVQENQQEQDPAKIKYELRAKRKFAAREELPSSYAAAGDPDADLYLSFPTTVTVERREDGTYYKFRRVYTPRRWAYVSYWEERFFNDEIEKLGEKPTEELTHEEQVKILRAFGLFEAHSQMEFAKAALEKCDPDLSPECWLRVRTALMETFKKLDFDGFVRRYAEIPEDDRPTKFEAEYEEMLSKAHQLTIESLKDVAGYDDAMVAAFEEAYDHEKRYHEITDEQGGHQFKIMLKMPGEVVAHNADRWDAEEKDYLVWEFRGDAFRDRPFELMVVSRLTATENE